MRSEFRSGSKSVPIKTVQYLRIYINEEELVVPVEESKNDLNMKFKKLVTLVEISKLVKKNFSCENPPSKMCSSVCTRKGRGEASHQPRAPPWEGCSLDPLPLALPSFNPSRTWLSLGLQLSLEHIVWNVQIFSFHCSWFLKLFSVQSISQSDLTSLHLLTY